MTGPGSDGQGPPDGTDAEEAERCPICLGVLAGCELAMPDSCCHVFCLRCLLTWAEMGRQSELCAGERNRVLHLVTVSLRLINNHINTRHCRACLGDRGHTLRH
ncbi:putative protein SCAF11 [Scophthalmus maximus]|uniref:RING-type domain-containing protein n=1 Tax=Scophthalmus maximus TaxID=52904 RepID=A0A2U9B1G7_SCOMX|nr:putative protein SCAF11 [Scophthalmus maximus]